jgi:hypothetical protein
MSEIAEPGVPVRQLPPHGRRVAPGRDPHHALPSWLGRRVGIGLSEAKESKPSDDEEVVHSEV